MEFIDVLAHLIAWIMRRIGLYGGEKYQDENDQFIGSTAEVSRKFKQVGMYFEGYVKLNGVQWKALCRTGQLPVGTIVVVKKLSNLTLEVEAK